ncbi:beta-lactamase family protein [Cellulosimicrobium terreum]|nr:beta-lactamase family protein [Cellulosimicrobium terreum]
MTRGGPRPDDLLARPGADEGWSVAAALVRTQDASVRAATPAAGPSWWFDLASLTKVFVAVAALRLVDDGLLDLDAPVREHLDVGAVCGGATTRHLLTHTSGLRATSSVWRSTDDAGAVLDDVVERPPLEAPGDVHRYSCLGFVVLGRLLEVISGTPLDRLVATRVAGLLGAHDLRWGSAPIDRTAPTEPGTPRGRVHDELAAATRRPVGNAGLFGTLDDVARLAQMVAGRGAVDGRQVVSEERWRELVVPDPAAQQAGAPYGQALALRRGDLAVTVSDAQVGHTGFTGTSFVVDLESGAHAVLLTNRVHGGRATSVDARRRALAGRLVPERHGG